MTRVWPGWPDPTFNGEHLAISAMVPLSPSNTTGSVSPNSRIDLALNAICASECLGVGEARDRAFDPKLRDLALPASTHAIVTRTL